MISLRKFLFLILTVLLAAFCAAALADTGYSLSPAPFQITLKDDRTVVGADSLNAHPELLTAIGMSKEDVLADWEARGVVLQAWSPIKTKYTCLEICVLQDADASAYRDLMHSDDRAAWKSYEDSFKNNEAMTALGYTFQALEKQQRSADGNRYLLLKYKRSFAGGDYRGYMARTVCAGYTLVFDLKVYNQLPTDTHANELYRVVRTVADSGAAGLPAVSGTTGEGEPGTDETGNGENTGTQPESGSSLLQITQAPPRETNENTFTVEGVTAPGAQVIGVLMKSVGDPMPQRFETIAHAKNGTFKLKMTIPENEENVWLVTLNVYENAESGTIMAEKVFDTTLYKKTVIPFELDAPVPEQIYADELEIKGTTMKAVDVQCIATDSSGNTVFDRKSHPNGTGRFNFTISLKNEDVYEIAVSVTKRGYDTKRFLYTVSRFLTDEARAAQIRKQSVHVGYGALTSRMDQYVGKTMSFQVWITAIDQIGDEWRVSAAGSKTGDHYSQPMIFMAEEEPPFAVEEKHALYGKCRGPYQIQSEEGIEAVPSFDLLLWD